MFRGILSVTAVFLVGLCVISAEMPQAVAKDDAKAAGEKPKAKAKANGKAKARPAAKQHEARLPALYRDVVTEQQRPEVAALLAKYNGKLAKLKAEIKSLTAERDQALESLLSGDQKAKLAQLKAEAKTKRAKPAK